MKKTRNILALLLAAAMLFSLAACGKDGEGGSIGGKVENTPAPEYVYASEFKTLSQSNQGYSAFLYNEKGFYSITNEKVGEYEHDEPAQWEGQYDIYEQRISFIGYDGGKTLLENYKPSKPENLEEGHTFDSYVNNLMEMGDGRLLVYENFYEQWSDAPEGTELYSDEWYSSSQYKDGAALRILDSTGAELSRVELDPDLGPDQYFYPYNMLLSPDGMLLCTWEQGIIAFDLSTGEKAWEIPMDTWPENLLRLKDGSVGVMSWGDGGYELRLIDMEAKALSDKSYKVPNGYSAVQGAGDYDLYYTNGTNFFGYKVETEEETKLFNWISCDVNNDEMGNYAVLADGRVVGITNTWDSNYENCTTELVTITKQPYDPSTQKTVLTLAAQAVNWEDRKAIIKFNRSSDQYRIEVLDYSEYNTEDDYEAGLTKLKTEIMAGNLPDILCLSGLSGSQLAAKGLIVDLYPYLEGDGEFSKEDFFPNVLAAAEQDGMLYSTVGSFYIQTVAGASSVVGSEPGWTYEELNAALATMPEGCEIFSSYTTRDQILSTGLALDMEQYVDWVSGKCNFDSQQFIDLLNFANQFPAEFDWENYEWTEEDDQWTRIAQGRQMLVDAYISDFDSSILQYQALFGGDIDDVTFIGYPTSEGVGSMLGMNSGYAITKNCKDPEGAWAFLRTFFTEEYQMGLWNFPSNKNAFNAKLKEAMTPEYMTDGEGNYILDENGNKIEESQGGFGWGDGMTVEIYAMTQEQADKLLELIENTTKVQDYNSAIYDIVAEQSAAFFAGQKSAEEVAKLVQSKANIFVNEQR